MNSNSYAQCLSRNDIVTMGHTRSNEVIVKGKVPMQSHYEGYVYQWPKDVSKQEE